MGPRRRRHVHACAHAASAGRGCVACRPRRVVCRARLRRLQGAAAHQQARHEADGRHQHVHGHGHIDQVRVREWHRSRQVHEAVGRRATHRGDIVLHELQCAGAARRVDAAQRVLELDGEPAVDDRERRRR
eukprot:1101628-Prymnesium_polylepis.1